MQDKASWQKRSFSLKPINWNNKMTQTTEMDKLTAQLVVAKELVEDNQFKAFEVGYFSMEARREAAKEVRKNESRAFNRVNESEAAVTRIEAEIAALKAQGLDR